MSNQARLAAAWRIQYGIGSPCPILIFIRYHLAPTPPANKIKAT